MHIELSLLLAVKNQQMHSTTGLLFNSETVSALTLKREESTRVIDRATGGLSLSCWWTGRHYFLCGEFWCLLSQYVAYCFGMFRVCLAGLG